MFILFQSYEYMASYCCIPRSYISLHVSFRSRQWYQHMSV